jgi:hypothetical protein
MWARCSSVTMALSSWPGVWHPRPETDEVCTPPAHRSVHRSRLQPGRVRSPRRPCRPVPRLHWTGHTLGVLLFLSVRIRRLQANAKSGGLHGYLWHRRGQGARARQRRATLMRDFPCSPLPAPGLAPGRGSPARETARVASARLPLALAARSGTTLARAVTLATYRFPPVSGRAGRLVQIPAPLGDHRQFLKMTFFSHPMAALFRR